MLYANQTGGRLDLTPPGTRFKFGEIVIPSLGTLLFTLPTPFGKIESMVHIVRADIPLLLGLDVLDKYRLVVNNVDNKLEGRSSPPRSEVIWSEDIMRKHGHLYFSPPISIQFSKIELEKLHKHFAHPSVRALFELLKRGVPDEACANTVTTLEKIRRECETCQKTANKPLKFKVSGISEEGADLQFNRQLDVDILWLNGRPVLHVCDHDTRFAAAQFLRGETTLHVWEALITSWVLIYHGIPEQILADQGSVFTSQLWRELLDAHGCKLRLIPIESHNSQGLIESKHNHLRKTFERLKLDFPDITDELALQLAIKARNDIGNPKGLVPTLLVFGSMPKLPPSNCNAPSIGRTSTNRERLQQLQSARLEMLKCVAVDHINSALSSKPPPAADIIWEPGQLVLVWSERDGWKGPFLLARVDGKTAYVHDKGGEPRPFSVSQIKPFILPTADTFAMHLSKSLRPYRLSENSLSVQHARIFVSEVVTPDDARSTCAKMQEAKLRELRGLIERGTFKVLLRADTPPRPNIMTTKFVLTIKHSGTDEELYEARLVVRGFQDRFKRYLVHEPNVVRATSIRVLIALASIFGFTIWTEDVTQAFVQSAGKLLRDVFIEPPRELGLEPDPILQLLMPLYGLSDAGDYWARTMLHHHRQDLRMTPALTDRSLFFRRFAENLVGMSATVVDDSFRAGTPQFVRIAQATGKRFHSKAPSFGQIKFAGLEIDARNETAELSQKTFISQLSPLKRNADYEDYRSLHAKVAWACQSRPDIACAIGLAAQVTKEKFEASPTERICFLNKIIKHLHANPEVVLRYQPLDVHSLSLHVFSDAAFANNDDYVCQLGYLAFLADKTSCALLDFKSMKARRITRSILAGELIAFEEAFDRAFVLKTEIEDMLGTRIPIRIVG